MASLYTRPESKQIFISFYPTPGSKLVRASLGTDQPGLAESVRQKVELLCALERIADVSLPDKVWEQFSLAKIDSARERSAGTQTPGQSAPRNTVKQAIEAYLIRAMAENVKHAQDDKVSRLRQFFGSELVESLDPRPPQTKNRISKKKVIKPWFKGTELEEITSLMLLKFLMGRNYSQSTKRHYRETFHQLFQIALKSGIHKPINPYNANPADDLPGFTKREESVTVLTRDQIDQQYAVLASDLVFCRRNE